jgi:hypothetical protein
VDLNDFFPDTASYHPYRDFLYETCERCPVWQTCRIAGLGEPTGWWGGTTMQERRYIKRETVKRNADNIFNDVQGAIRERTTDAMFAYLKRRGWNVTHRSLHQFHFLPMRKHDIYLGFRYRKLPETVG